MALSVFQRLLGWLGFSKAKAEAAPEPKTASQTPAVPPPASVSTPSAAAIAAEPAKGKSKPEAKPRPSQRPETDEHAVKPEVAIRQMLKVKSLAEAAKAQSPDDVRAQTLNELKALKELPALKSLAQGFARIVSRPDVDVSEVVDSISKDQGLSVRILRMANSAEVGSEQRIDSLDVAVQMLGVNRVRQAADAVSILSLPSSAGDSLDWKHLWIHALGTAAISERLEGLIRGERASAVYVAGLLHDAGKIVLSTLQPEAYRGVLLDAWNELDPLERLEVARFGVDHAEAGVNFARQNGMGEIIVQAIAHHGRPEQAEAHRLEVALVSLGNFLAKAYGVGFSGSRLSERDGEFADHPAWAIIEQEIGRRPDIDQISDQMKVFIKRLRTQLAALREGL
jgi:putative nucleotidyltransferase with HDIG domain